MGKHGIEFVKCCVNIKSIFQGLYPFDSGTSPYMEKHLLKITGIGEYRPFQ